MCVPHHGDEASDEAEVGEVVGVDGGGRVDLQTVVVLAGVLEQTVHGVQDLVGQQEEPLPAGREDTGRQRGHRETTSVTHILVLSIFIDVAK